MTAANTGAHHHASPACTMSSPSAIPSGMNASPMGAASRSTSRLECSGVPCSGMANSVDDRTGREDP